MKKKAFDEYQNSPRDFQLFDEQKSHLKQFHIVAATTTSVLRINKDSRINSNLAISLHSYSTCDLITIPIVFDIDIKLYIFFLSLRAPQLFPYVLAISHQYMYRATLPTKAQTIHSSSQKHFNICSYSRQISLLPTALYITYKFLNIYSAESPIIRRLSHQRLQTLTENQKEPLKK